MLVLKLGPDLSEISEMIPTTKSLDAPIPTNLKDASVAEKAALANFIAKMIERGLVEIEKEVMLSSELDDEKKKQEHSPIGEQIAPSKPFTVKAGVESPKETQPRVKLRGCLKPVKQEKPVLRPQQKPLPSHVVSPEPRNTNCLLYTSPSPRDLSTSRMPSSA